MEMLTDNHISKLEEDEFGFESYANLFSSIIQDTNKLPLCIGIFGEWGTGKSSLMSMTKDAIDNHGSIKSIWFNPWKYDKKEDLWNALIQTILYEITEAGDKQSKNKAKDLAKSITWLMIKKGIAVASSGIISEGDIKKIKDTISKQDELHYRNINHFEERFEEVIRLYTNNGKLVVFIDDLDRCLPENAITVLESLKLFIGNAKCVFILGMDRYIIEQGINFRFGGKINMSGRDYLEKIIQVPFFLPPVPFEKLRRALEVSKTADFSEQIWQLIKYGLGGNPRKTKRFVNSFYLLREILKHPQTLYQGNYKKSSNLLDLDIDTQNFYFAKLLIIQMNFPKFYNNLKLHPEDWKIFERAKMDFEGRPQLDEFWEDEIFRNFMLDTSETKNYPSSPNVEIMESLMKAVSLVTPEDKSSFVSTIASEMSYTDGIPELPDKNKGTKGTFDDQTKK